MKNFLFAALFMGFAGVLEAQTAFTLVLNPVAGTTPLALNQDFAQQSGQMAVYTRIQYYISDVGLVHDGGQVTYLDSSYLLVNAVRTHYVMPAISINNIEKIRFSVGVGADVNHNDPNSWPAGHPLTIQNPGMHWGWTAGYKFAAFEGEADSDNNGLPDEAWQLHPTGDQLLRNVEVPVTPSFNGNGIEIALDYDLRAWVRDIDLATAGFDHEDGPGCVKLMDNINTYSVFRSSGTTGLSEPLSQGPTLYFNHVEAERPIVYYKSLQSKGAVQLMVTDMQGQIVFRTGNLPSEGKARIETRLSQGIYTCTLLQSGGTLLSKKFQVTR